MLDKNDPVMQKLMDEIMSGLAEWRLHHSRATFSEIEEETMKRMGQLQARIMQEIAMTSEARDWQTEIAPKCPECGGKMKKRSEQERRLQAQGGSEVILKRAYAICSKCGAEIFPPG
jgi:YgiT-type zinc finger domain-containing protein